MEPQDEAELCFPQLLNTSCKKLMRPQSEALLLHILLSSVSLLTVALNLLVIISVSHFRQLHTPTNHLLLSLAVSDFLMGLIVIPGEILRINGCRFLGDLICSLCDYVSFIIVSASVGNMVLISVDRYVAICYPLQYTHKITVRRVTVYNCLCWLFSVIYIIVILILEVTPPQRSCLGQCMTATHITAGAVDFVLTFILPVTVICILYMRVFVVAVSQARAIRSHIRDDRIQLSKKSELKAARTLGVVILVFLTCYCPYYCVQLSGDGKLDSLFLLYLLDFNSCLNPVIYALLYPWFRKAVKLIVTLQILQPDSCETNVL